MLENQDVDILYRAMQDDLGHQHLSGYVCLRQGETITRKFPIGLCGHQFQKEVLSY